MVSASPHRKSHLIPAMNCEVFYLKEFEVQHVHIRDVLRCILHTIMFNRALGLVRPCDVDSELFEITYDVVLQGSDIEAGDSRVCLTQVHGGRGNVDSPVFYVVESNLTAYVEKDLAPEIYR